MTLPLADYVNKGEEKHQNSLIPSPTAAETHVAIDLTYIPQGRTTNPVTEITIPSSISVESTGGTAYSEVYTLANTVGKTFYADPLAKKLWFNSSETGTQVNITYLTRGDIIDANIINNIQNTTRSLGTAVPSVRNTIYGVIPDSSWISHTINGGSTVYGVILDLSSYTSDASYAIVNITAGFNSSTGTILPTASPLYIVGASGFAATDLLIASSVTATGDYILSYEIIIPTTAPGP